MERVEKTMESTTPATTISSHLAVRPAWLDRRREAALEPDLPIVDPHHHLIDRPESGRYLLQDLLADIGGSGHNVVATVYLEWLSMYRADGPAEMRPLGEIEFANGVAAMSASGGYGKPRICAGIVGHADLALGARVRDVLEAMIASGGGRAAATAASAASGSFRPATRIRPNGAPSSAGRRDCCWTSGCAKASRNWRRSASVSMPSCTTPNWATCSTWRALIRRHRSS